ncbi:MAG: class I SAM-dependent methyltransferase [Planctomycetes bacterium]|nr:class I SAM-dependent methyltransferase [Planctomycetota bacterium]
MNVLDDRSDDRVDRSTYGSSGAGSVDALPPIREKDAPDAFTAWCRGALFTPEVVRAEGIVQRYCDAQLIRVFRSLDLDECLRAPRSAREIASLLRLEQTADVAVDAALRRLAKRGHCAVEERSDAGYFRVVADASTCNPEDEISELSAEMVALGEDYVSALDFVKFGADHFLEALRDDPDLLDRVLSGKEPMFADLWHRATNVDPLQDLHGRMGAHAACDLFDGGVALEVGGGTGNGTRHLLGDLARAGRLERIERYVFTDVSIPFVLGTRREISKLYPSLACAWQFLDVNKPFASQKVAPASVDLIYGVNAAHVACDVVAFLTECREALRPRGRILFAERVRRHVGEMAPRELTLNLSRYHRTAAQRDPEVRPDHAYLAPLHWIRSLERAGFERAQILPDLDSLESTFPNCYATVVTAVRGS